MIFNTIKKNRYGFTLVELIVVMAIISILSGLVFTSLKTARDRARYTAMSMTLEEISTAAHIDFNTNKVWANDTGPGNASSFVGTTIPVWPTAACPNWTYDWENWSVVGEDPTIRITARNTADAGTNANAMFYLCIQSSDTVSCHAGGPAVGGPDTSIDVKRSTPGQRKLVCL